MIDDFEETKTMKRNSVKRNSVKRNNSQDQVNIQNKDKLLSSDNFSNTNLKI